MRRIFRGCLLIIVMPVLSVLLTLSIIEGGARLYMSANHLHLDAWSFRKSQPAPYQDAPYFSQAFIDESMTQPGDWFTPEGTHLILPADYDGEWFHVRDHQRVTTGQPDTYQHTVYVFGGSTVYASEVPDAYTIPSQLQAMLNQRDPDTYRVENYGVTSVDSSQELERLLTIAVQPGDTVIFYDGINDAVQAIYYRNAGGDMAATIEAKLNAMTGPERTRYNIYRWLSPSSAAVALLLYPYSTLRPDWLDDPAEVEILANDMAAEYAHNIDAARAYVTELGGRFVVLLQPNLFTLAHPTPYEAALQRNPYQVPPGMDTALRTGTPVLRSVLEGLGVEWVDLTGAFDGHDGELYLDYAHVAHAGNAQIAGEMMKVIGNSR